MSIRLASLTAAALLAGCSLNPFSRDNNASPEPVVAAPAEVSQSRSLEGRRTSATSALPATSSNYSSGESTSVPLSSTAPDSYVVKRGDTLWDISATFLTDPWYWPEIWQINPQVANPHLIYPGDILSLIYVDGQPRLRLERGISAQRMSPQIRATQLDEAINTISYEQIAAFLTRSEVLAKDEVSQLPYILQTRGDHLIAGEGNDIYVRTPKAGIPLRGEGSRYSVVHIGEPLHDPDNNDVVGYEALYVAKGELNRTGDPATVRLIESSREAYSGDRLVDREIDIPLNFFPKAPSQATNGQIISVIDGVSLIGQYQVVVLNRGDRHGLAPGDVLSVFTGGETVRDRFANSAGFMSGGFLGGGEKVTLPDELAGTVMIFKTYDRISYALVMSGESEMKVLDAVRNPS